MGAVAKRYGISDVMLKKICRQLQVPSPPRGYWAKVNAGQQPKRSEPPSTTGPTVMFGKGKGDEANADDEPTDPMSILTSNQIALLVETSSRIEFKEKIRLRPQLATLRKSLSFPDRIRRVNHPSSYSFNESVSKEGAARALCAIEVLARAVEQVGGSMRSPLQFDLLGESISLEVSEAAKKVPHSLTPEEEKELKDYEEGKGRYSWYGKPQIRKWDYEFTGQMKFAIVADYASGCHDCIAEGSRHLNQKAVPDLGKLLGSVFLAMCQACATIRAKDKIAKKNSNR